MPRLALVSFLLLVLLGASTTRAPAGDQRGAVGTVALAERSAPAPHACPPPVSGDAPAHCARPAEAAEVSARTADVSLPEPPAWMVWLSGIAVAAVIAVRRSRRGGL